MTRFNIVDGPSKLDLMLSLFDGDSGLRRKVTFLLERSLSRNHLHPVINKVGREDGSGENWMFEGYCRKVNGQDDLIRGFFSTRTRTGWVEMNIVAEA